MRLGDKIRLRLRSLFRRGRLDRELDHELRFHLDQLMEENIAAGMLLPNDPWVCLAVTALLGAVTVIASYIPASRAAKIDPLAALRQE